MIHLCRSLIIPCLLAIISSPVILINEILSVQELAKDDKQKAILMHPTGLRVVLSRRKPESFEPPSEADRPFRTDENIYFLIEVTSNYPEPLEVRSFNRHYLNRPELFHEGEKVPYQERIAKNLASIDVLADYERRVQTVTLLPATSTTVDHLVLSHWYELLKPGRYRLTSRRRFIIDGDWVETSSISFEVR